LNVHSPTPDPISSTPWRVHVLCAQWCGVCRDYRSFVDASHRSSGAQWVWIDIETHSDALGDLDIENFPTLLVTEGDEVRFLGTITPQPELAERLMASLLSGNRYNVPEVRDLAGIVQALRAL
jgi:thioredoxin 1